jgi:hypothetical protein
LIRITIEAETPAEGASLFKLWLDDKVIGEGLTAAQAHLLVGEILARIALPKERVDSK